MANFKPKARRPTPAATLDSIFARWVTSQDPYEHEDLLKAVLDTIYTYYVGKHGEEVADDISSTACDRINRALPNYSGPSPLKPFDTIKASGKFYAYIAMVGRAACRDYYKNQTDATCGNPILSHFGDDWQLESYDHALDDPYRSDGRSWKGKTRDPDTITDSRSVASMGKSSYGHRDEEVFD